MSPLICSRRLSFQRDGDTQKLESIAKLKLKQLLGITSVVSDHEYLGLGLLWSTRQREERSGAGLARGALALLTDLRPSSPPWGAREGRVRGPFRFGLFLVGLGRDLELECVREISLLRNLPRTPRIFDWDFASAIQSDTTKRATVCHESWCLGGRRCGACRSFEKRFSYWPISCVYFPKFFRAAANFLYEALGVQATV